MFNCTLVSGISVQNATYKSYLSKIFRFRTSYTQTTSVFLPWTALRLTIIIGLTSCTNLFTNKDEKMLFKLRQMCDKLTVFNTVV